MSTLARHTFLDLFRGLFIVMMVEGHLVRTVLTEQARAAGVFQLHEILHGITAPGFLFTSGFALAIASHRKRSELQAWTPGLARRLWRAIALIGLGYALHIPYWSLTKTLTASTAAQYNTMIAFGVLQLIGTVILLARLLFFVIRRDKIFLTALSGLFVLAVYLAPTMWDPAVTGQWPDILLAAVSGATGSPYPLFPFAGFFLAGVVVSWMFLDQGKLERERSFMIALASSGILVTGFALMVSISSTSPAGSTDFWYTSPHYFWIRLGVLFLLMSLFWFLEHWHKRAPELLSFRPQWMTVLGRESYFVYVVHLFIIFGWLINPFVNLRTYFGSDLSWPAALALAAGVVAVLAMLSGAWHRLKKEHTILMQGLLVWFWSTIAYYIVVNPF